MINAKLDVTKIQHAQALCSENLTVMNTKIEDFAKVIAEHAF